MATTVKLFIPTKLPINSAHINIFFLDLFIFLDVREREKGKKKLKLLTY